MEEINQKIEKGELVEIRVLNDSMEATLVEDLMKKENIHCLIQKYEDLAFDGLFTKDKGFGRVLVFPEDGEKARTILDDYLDNHPEEEDTQ